MRRHLPLLAVVSTLAACGGSGGGSAQPGGSTTSLPPTAAAVGQSLLVTADAGGLHFDKATYRARAGMVVVGLRNLSAARRNIAIRGNGVDERGPIVGKGKTSVVSVSLEPGTYLLYSSTGGHDEPGMHARLVVAG